MDFIYIYINEINIDSSTLLALVLAFLLMIKDKIRPIIGG